MPLIDRLQVLKLKRSYVLLEAGPYNSGGFNGIAPSLRSTAAEALSLCFEFDVHPDDVQVSVVSVEGDPGSYRFIYRATWDPNQQLAELVGGPEHGRKYTLAVPSATVTICHGMGRYKESVPDKYCFVGFEVDSRRFIYQYQEKPPDA